MKMFLVLFSVISLAAAAKADSPSLRLSVGSITGPARVEDSQLVRARIAGYMTDFYITNYMLLSVGIGENFSVCFSVDSVENRNGIVKDLRSLNLDPNTSLSIAPVLNCVREE